MDSGNEKKIVMVTYVFDPSALPPMLNNARSLARVGYDVEILCISFESNASVLKQDRSGFVVRPLPLRVLALFDRIFGLSPRRPVHAALQYSLSYLEYLIRAFFACMWSGADIIEANDLPALLPAVLAGWVRRTPVVYRAHELYPEMHANVRFASVWRLLERMLVPRVDTVMTPEPNRSRIYAEEYGARRQPVTVMNCPPYSPSVRTQTLRHELRAKGIDSSFIVLYQGLYDDSRCIREIIAAATHFVEGATLVLIGSGYGEFSDLSGLISDPTRVVALSRVPYDRLQEYTASADVGLLFYRNSCRNNYYCAPNKLHEYMMMGLPVITNDYPGIAALVNGSDIGLAVDATKPSEIAAAVNRLANAPDRREQMKMNALRLSKERFNWEIEFLKVEAEYRRLLGDRFQHKATHDAHGSNQD